MKKYIIPIIVFLFAVINVYSQSGWFWQNPLPQGNTLNDVRFLNSTTGYSVGNFGTIIKTTNAGVNWQVISIPTKLNLNSLFFSNNFTGYVCGDSGVVGKTTDGGVSWVIQRLGNLPFNGICFGNLNSGCVVGNSGKIFITSNAGNYWNEDSYTSANFKSVQFLNDSVVYVVGGTYFLKSTSAGNVWNEILTTGPYYHNLDLNFLNLNTGFIGGFYSLGSFPYTYYSVLLKTQNGGGSWNEIITESVSANSFTKVRMYDQFHGIVLGLDANSNNFMYLTNDGSNWNRNNFPDNRGVNSLSFTSLDTLISAGIGGGILKSYNGGSNWYAMQYGMNQSISSMNFINNNFGYCIGSTANILNSTNGGQSWNTQFSSGIYLDALTFVDSLIGFAGGSGGQFLKTTNGGINWSSSYLSNMTIRDISFSDYLTGYAVGDLKAMKTTDGGNTWSQMPITSNWTLYRVHFFNALTGFVASTTICRIYKTTDGGASWGIYVIGSNIYDMKFIDQNTGFIGDDRYIFRTTNSGAYWSDYPITGPWGGFYFSNSQTGYATNTVGGILKTTNCGTNWNTLNTITNNSLNSIYFFNDNTGIVAGNYGTILRTTDAGGEFVNINNIGSEVLNTFSLFQNYPNPFNPVTKIKFDVPAVGNSRDRSVKLIIYDVLGREVAMLVNEQLKPGSYEVEWDGSNFASGIYFYQLVTGDFVQTKRMVLIK